MFHVKLECTVTVSNPSYYDFIGVSQEIPLPSRHNETASCLEKVGSSHSASLHPFKSFPHTNVVIYHNCTKCTYCCISVILPILRSMCGYEGRSTYSIRIEVWELTESIVQIMKKLTMVHVFIQNVSKYKK